MAEYLSAEYRALENFQTFLEVLNEMPWLQQLEKRIHKDFTNIKANVMEVIGLAASTIVGCITDLHLL